MTFLVYALHLHVCTINYSLYLSSLLSLAWCFLLLIATNNRIRSYEANDSNRQILLHSSCGNVVDVICFAALFSPAFSLLVLLVSVTESFTIMVENRNNLVTVICLSTQYLLKFH